MNILIVENEEPASIRLRKLLRNIDQDINVVAITESVVATINWLQNNRHPELILMDVQLDDGLCFEIFETVNLNIPIIFTTAYNQYTLSAFKVNSVDYLLKPIDEESLVKAIEKYKLIHRKPINNNLINQLIKGLNEDYKTRFLVKIGEHYKSVPTNEIACFYILERATFIRTASDKDYSLDYSLDYLIKIIDPDKFFRINRNCIVNINAIGDILSYSSSRLEIKLINKKPIYDLIVSKGKVCEFKKWVDK